MVGVFFLAYFLMCGMSEGNVTYIEWNTKFYKRFKDVITLYEKGVDYSWKTTPLHRLGVFPNPNIEVLEDADQIIVEGRYYVLMTEVVMEVPKEVAVVFGDLIPFDPKRNYCQLIYSLYLT